MTGFQDSLDSAYPGTCGTKKVTLDLANTSAPFLHLTSDTDPLTFEYDVTKTTAGDIGIHTVKYTAEITSYRDETTAITGSFTFEITEGSSIGETKLIDQAISA